MKQLSGIDVGFLAMETAGSYGHVASMNIFDLEGAPEGAAGVEATKRLILERIDRLAPFRRRLVEVPLGLDLPYWIEDPDFDIDYHVRHHAVPAPGTPQQLAEVVARIHARALDRRRPLWELYVIEGVDGGRKVAQVTKVHHATIDGASGALMLAAILDPTPDVEHVAPPAWTAEAVPSGAEMLWLTARQVVRNPERFIRISVRALRELGESTRNGGIKTMAEMLAQPLPGPIGGAIRDRLRGGETEVDEPPPLPMRPAPRTPFNASITPHRRFAYTTIPLDDAKVIRRAFGCTFNDVVMSLCAATLRQYLIEHDALPIEPLIAAVPVSVRTGAEDDMYQNRVSMILGDLATDEPDLRRRLRRVQRSMDRAKTQFAALPADALQDFSQFAPPALSTRAMRLYSRLRIADRMNPPFNLIISNVPGPRQPLYSSGARLEHFYPISAVVDGQGLNMTVQSYVDNLDFGFVACRELVPDLWRLTELLQDAMADHLALAEAELSAGSTPAAPSAKRPAKKTAAKKTPAAKKRAAAKKAPAKRKAAAKKVPAKRKAAAKASTAG